MRLLRLSLVLIALLCASAAPPPDWQTLVRQGEAAFARGDYTSAAALFEEAGDSTTNPGLVAFDLATARYRLALGSDADRARLAREAEQSYRCCIEPDDPRQARALYGLGNALLLQAGERDAETLKAAAQLFRRCLAETNLDNELERDARHNLERARLLLLQLPPAPAHTKDESSGNVPPKPRNSRAETPNAQKKPKDDSSAGMGKPDRTGDQAKPEKGMKPIDTDEPPTPGAGHLPPVPDGADLPPLTAEDAARHLELASQRIEEDFRAHRRSKASAPAANVRDW